MVESASQMVYRLVDKILQGNQLALVCCIYNINKCTLLQRLKDNGHFDETSPVHL